MNGVVSICIVFLIRIIENLNKVFGLDFIAEGSKYFLYDQTIILESDSPIWTVYGGIYYVRLRHRRQ